MPNTHNTQTESKTQPPRRPRYRTLREDYVEFCGGNTVAALLLDYFASVERNHDEQRLQGERPSPWRSISGKFGGLITLLQPTPKRETVYRALNLLIERGLIEAHSENGQSTKPNQTPAPNRFRLIAWRLRQLEHNWAATSHGENGHLATGGVLSGTHPPVLLGTHESEDKNQIIREVDFIPTDQQKAVGALARFYEACCHQMLGPGAQREMNRIVEDYALAQIEQAVLAVGDKELERPFQYLRKVLSNAELVTPAAPAAPSGPWGRELT